MKQQELQEKAEKIQEECIREMEHIIPLLEEENRLQRQMLDDIHS